MGTLWIALAVLGGLVVLCLILLFTPVGRWVGNRVAPRLAKWQLPDRVVFIDEVPKTSVGKFSKKTLRDRYPTMPD